MRIMTIFVFDMEENEKYMKEALREAAFAAGDSLTLCRVTDLSLTAVCECYYRRCSALSFIVDDD